MNVPEEIWITDTTFRDGQQSMAPYTVKQIVDLFLQEETNPLHAQLICTSHSRELIETGVRRDQVWTIHKNAQGISSMRRVSNIPGMRAYENNGYKYLEDAFGNIPTNLFT